MPSLIPSDAVPLPQISIAAGSIGASYTVIGAFASSPIMMIITSTLDKAVQLSFDGVHDHIVVPAGSTQPVIFPINFKNNLTALMAGSVSVKEIGSAPTTGSLYISAFSAVFP